MRKLCIIVLMMAMAPAAAQYGLRPFEIERLLASIHTDVGASIKEKGLNQAFELQYSGGLIYVKAGLEYFTGLPVTSYFDWHGGMGVNMTAGTQEQLRTYIGARTGRIYRFNYGANSFHGFEAGITYRIIENLNAGGRVTFDYRNDQKLFNDPPFYRGSFYVELTYTVKRLKP